MVLMENSRRNLAYLNYMKCTYIEMCTSRSMSTFWVSAIQVKTLRSNTEKEKVSYFVT